jgi:hypothetical protein
MIPGLTGHLVSQQVLERYAARAGAREFRRQTDQWRGPDPSLGPSSSLRLILERAQPLLTALGFPRCDAVRIDRSSASATLRGGPHGVALVVVPWGERLGGVQRLAAAEAARRGAEWALLFNVTHLRLIHAARAHSRRFCDLALDLTADDDDARWGLQALFAAQALLPASPGVARTVNELIRESDLHTVAVCRWLRSGVLQATIAVLNALVGRSGRDPLAPAFEQALTIVYRMLFLFFAEARSLVPLWHPVYRESYSLERLRESALRSSSAGLWEALQAISRLAHAGCHAGDLRVTPFNGRLFAPARAPLAERHDLDDELARRALIVLSTRPADDHEGRVPIAYRDLSVEELGAVYETLLDYAPHVECRPPSPRKPLTPVVTLRAGSGLRKSTGSFYTPRAIAEYLVARALGPLVRDAAPQQILSLRVLDPSMGSGAFLVSSCAFLADAYEAALVRAGGCHPGDIGPREQALIRRTIAERCLYGVDSNPMAVQLGRLSLWLATLAADRPLSFLDHHLLTGDSLVGAWLSCLRYPPTAGRKPSERPLPLLAGLDVEEPVRMALPVRFRLAHDPNDTPAQVRAKEHALSSLASPESPLAKWKQVADLWCSRWFSRRPLAPAIFGALSDSLLTNAKVLPESLRDEVLSDARAIAAARRFFHWELEFPEVFFDADGTRRPDAGFDAVIGNPPWDMVRAEPGGEGTDASRLVRFTRDAGIYQAQAGGHANRYQMFLERAIALARPGGSIALVLPSGLATDHGSASLRRLLLTRSAVEEVVGFDNRRAIFPIHRSVRFLLVSARVGTATDRMRCRFGETDPSVLEPSVTAAGPPESGQHGVIVTRALLEKISGPDLTIPECRSALDLGVVERAAALFAPLGATEGWHAHFGRELNATEDREHLRAVGRGLPVLGGRQIEPFRTLLRTASLRISSRAATHLLQRRHHRARLAYRDVASATNRVTLIAAILPPGCVSTHTLFCLRTPLALFSQLFLCGIFNSLVVNYLVRLRVTSHVSTAVVEQLPIPTRDQAGPAYAEIAALARRLARRHKPALTASLNARVARLYRLTGREFQHVLDTFPLVPASERQMAWEAYDRLG